MLQFGLYALPCCDGCQAQKQLLQHLQIYTQIQTCICVVINAHVAAVFSNRFCFALPYSVPAVTCIIAAVIRIITLTGIIIFLTAFGMHLQFNMLCCCVT